jgi:hypothetical protein
MDITAKLGRHTPKTLGFNMQIFTGKSDGCTVIPHVLLAVLLAAFPLFRPKGASAIVMCSA